MSLVLRLGLLFAGMCVESCSANLILLVSPIDARFCSEF